MVDGQTPEYNGCILNIESERFLDREGGFMLLT